MTWYTIYELDKTQLMGYSLLKVRTLQGSEHLEIKKDSFMKRLATVTITPETVAFVLRDITGELFSYEFPRSRYNSVLDVLRDVARPRGSVDYVFVNADWLDKPLGKHIRDIDWTIFCMDEVPRHVGETVELTTNAPDVTMAMLRIVQDELTAATRSAVLA